MSEQNTNSSISREDATRLERSYKILAQLQRKTLSFLRALGEYEKRNRWRRRRREANGSSGGGVAGTDEDADTDDGPSRIAFIVTPLMVNHYNHMHRVYRASMYGKVPDLCDQTGGIVCADFSALREELATRTTDVNRSLTTVFRATSLPGVNFEFDKNRRDNVLETALRLLDSINVKQPDLTYGIRDDYIQNVRAIQESLTGALEKSRERAAELQSRLDDALRKLRLCEKNMVSADRGNGVTEDALRREILKLKDTVLEQQRRLLEQEVSFNERFVNLVQANEESELLRRLRDRLKQRFDNETEVLTKAREEISAYAEKEMEQMIANFHKIREDVIGYAARALARSEKEREESRTLFQTLLSREDALRENETADRCSKLQNDYVELLRENDRLRQRHNDGAAESRENDTIVVGLRKEVEDLSKRLDAAAVARDEQIRTAVNENEKLKERVEQLRQFNEWQEMDLNLFYGFLTAHVDTASALGHHMHVNGLAVYSDTSRSRLIPYLEAVLTDERVKTYIQQMETARAAEIVNNSGVIEEIEQSRYALMRYEAVIHGLVENMQRAYTALAEFVPVQPIRHEEVPLDGLNDYFARRFGEPLLRSFIGACAGLKRKYEDDKNVIEQENRGLRENVEALRAQLDAAQTEKERQADANGGGRAEKTLEVLDGDPTLFESILSVVYNRPRTDALRKLLYDSYYSCSVDNVTRYETSTENEALKLYHLVDYDVLTDNIRDIVKRRHEEKESGLRELENRRLNEPQYFLDYFLNQLGNAWVESYVGKKSLPDRNRLASALFKRYYIPVVNKESFVISIEGPFANFSMVYKV